MKKMSRWLEVEKEHLHSLGNGHSGFLLHGGMYLVGLIAQIAKQFSLVRP